MTKKSESGQKEEKTIVLKKQEVSRYEQEVVSIETMIMSAIKQNVPVETMERFLAMRKELKAEYAQEQFVQAMAKFQQSCPVIKKNKQVFDKQGKLRYSFASLDSIVGQTKKLISECGLSYSFENTVTEKTMVVECVVTHISGHSKSSPFTVNLGTEDYMTDVQKSGARSTFAKRYAFSDAFGIMTSDEDTDAVETPADSKEISDAMEKLDKCMDAKTYNATWNSFSKEVRNDKGMIKHALDVKALILDAKKNENS